ncbi:hypothetical protein HMPREF9418_0425 [Neisseria macacae ATCC 33926]|uniref:Uncharacterized protein n=1 Tax=Neisseria macacae ATCC 33926 TaxID=997348 RepID=A0AA36ULN1_9NEIS|nr:hypothetical protein HMPREF9418_0425 [Neisseria macacae ATCC 33926]
MTYDLNQYSSFLFRRFASLCSLYRRLFIFVKPFHSPARLPNNPIPCCFRHLPLPLRSSESPLHSF